MVQLVVDQTFILRHMAEQLVGAEGDAHAVPGQVVGCDLLLQLQLNLRQKMRVVADPVSALPGIIAGSQKKEGLVLEILQRNRRNVGV